MSSSHLSVAVGSHFSQHGSCLPVKLVTRSSSTGKPVREAENSSMSGTVDLPQVFDPISLSGIWGALQKFCFLETFVNIASHPTNLSLEPSLPEFTASPSELQGLSSAPLRSKKR